MSDQQGACNQRAPVEGDPQETLWEIGIALHERIDRDHAQAGNRRDGGRQGELRQHRQPDQRLKNDKSQCLLHADLTRWNGPCRRAGNLAIDIPVGDVIPGTARAPHGQRTNAKQHPIPQQHQNTVPGPMPKQRHAPPAGQQQQPGPNRAVPSGQARIWSGKGRQPAVHPIAFGNIRPVLRRNFCRRWRHSAY